jgi:Cdc6-like AAA superfamily ATPase
MREFNVEGPCDPARHFTVMREALVRKGIEKVEKGKYFTIFAPRQAGKTTYFQLLIRQLQTSAYLPIWITTEDLQNATTEKFYATLDHDLKVELAKLGLAPSTQISDNLSLHYFFEELAQAGKVIILIIDEFDGVPAAVLGDLMHTFRKLYHKKELHGLHSLILVGVRNISGVVLDHASPFNIADEVEVPYFTKAEVEDLIGQYEQESKQPFQKKVVAKIYENTLGQPGLVNALCKELVERYCTDRSKAVDVTGFQAVLDYFIRGRIDKHISNIVNKAAQHKDFVLKILFDDSEIPFTIDDERIKDLRVHGVIADVDGFVDVPIPLYKKRLINAFRPLGNGEKGHYFGPQDQFDEFHRDGGGLDVDKIIRSYIHYVQRRGFRAFDTENLKESAFHYSFDAYINFFIKQLGGETFMEVPSSRGRLDALVIYQNNAYVIEIKRWSGPFYYQKGKRQLAAYAKSEGLSEGYYVVFSGRHTESDKLFEQEEIDGVTIHSYIVRTNFERPSDLKP